MNKPRLFITLCVACLIGVGPSYATGGLDNLFVRELYPKPNYPLCTDPDDMRDLTDGLTMRFPMWVHRKCVGWFEQGPIRIEMELPGGPDAGAFTGTLSFHSAKGSHAGVDLPARIDLYYGEGVNERYHYAGGAAFDSQQYADRSSHWLPVKVTSKGNKLLAIVRPRGSYLFLDEIRWNAEVSLDHAELVPIGDRLACERDSLKRHRQHLLDRIRPPQEDTAAWAETFGSVHVPPWVVENPYSPLPIYPTKEQVNEGNQGLELVGSQSESEAGCIGLLNPGKTEKKIQITFSGDPRVLQALSLSQVMPILSADGRLVYDPLIPVKKQILLPGLQASYFWLQADLRLIPAGRHRVVVTFADAASLWTHSLPITISVAPVVLKDQHRPASINWAYTSDLPIWRDRKAAIEDLTRHGINVFVLHPSVIPMPHAASGWDVKKAVRFVEDAKLYRGKGLILLYLGWEREKAPSWLSPSYGANETKHRETLKRWLVKIRASLEGQGIPVSEWALYPIDEPRGEDLRLLQKLASWIKEADPQIQIYANPITSTTIPSYAKDLVPLKGLVDFWQPDLRFAQGSGAPFFTTLEKSWWVYSNTPMPAKSASPWYYYRLLAWRAWSAGASGIGFWSYSDTSGTSAWDDLDGRRPDWAVVYEGVNGAASPVSSRRWEAFREGVEDYTLFESAIKGDLPWDSSRNAFIREKIRALGNSENASFHEVQALRKALLGLN
ncbi:MAG: hypothetical protein HPY67_09085 [Syntrophaceae bacterium]|nr:hypothetical protein [Syntrophaceae bacterium]